MVARPFLHALWSAAVELELGMRALASRLDGAAEPTRLAEAPRRPRPDPQDWLVAYL